MGSGQASRAYPAGAAQARIPEEAGGQHRRSGQWRPGPRQSFHLHDQRHAADDGRDRADRVHHPAGDHLHNFEAFQPRRIYTDGRDFSSVKEEPSLAGYSIGKWSDTDGDGRYDTLEIETRNFKGPRTVESSGIPLAEDNETVVKEKIYLDKANSDVMHNIITIIDNAFTHPWTVDKRYRRERNVVWFEDNCNENNHHIVIGKENYYIISGDGFLMPARKNQAPPDAALFQAGNGSERAARHPGGPVMRKPIRLQPDRRECARGRGAADIVAAHGLRRRPNIRTSGASGGASRRPASRPTIRAGRAATARRRR